MDKQLLLYEYEQILLGNKAGFPSYYFKYGDDTSRNYALYVIKFAVENYLRWDPYDMKEHFTKEIAEQMKLEPLMKYIDFPPELDKDTDYFYLATYCYPNIIRFDVKELVLQTYRNVLEGKLAKFPKEYLSGTQGMMRAEICFQYMLSHYLSFSSIQEMYQYFSEPSGKKALREYRLSNICNEMFEHPIDYLHKSLPDAQKDDFWYHYYRFRAYNEQQQKKSKSKVKIKG